MSQIAKLKKLRERYSRLVIAKDAGVSITVIDRALKTGEIKNENLAKWLNYSNRENALEKLKEEITDKRGRRGGSKAATSKKAPAKKKVAAKKKAAAKKPRAAKKAKDDATASSEAAAV